MKLPLYNWASIKKNPYDYASKCSYKNLEKIITIASNKYYNDNPIITNEQFDILYSYLEELASIKKNPYNYATKCTQEKLEKMITIASNKYYNDNPIITDEQFDILYSYLEEHFKSSEVLIQIGVNVASKVKTKLPVFLGSMEKIKPDTQALNGWQKDYKGPYTLSDKLDGMSLLIVSKDGKINAYTRGNGTVGQDISWIIEFINIGKLINGMVRGELIVSKKNWKIIQTAYPKYSNPRNFVSGYTGRTKVDPKLMQYIDFIAYEYIYLDTKPIKCNEQFDKLTELGLSTVFHTQVDTISNLTLSMLLEKRRAESEYDIDGIIITDNGLYDRPTGKYPTYAKAFKMVLDDQTAEVNVLNIKWDPSMYGTLNPVIQISPVVLDSVTISNVSGYNARFITNNDIGGLIGPGSIIKITRSGGVIPKVIKVIKPYQGQQSDCLPNIALFDFIWNETNVDIVLKNPELNDTVKIKRIYHFFNTLGVSYFKIGMVTKLFNKNYNTINKVVSIKKSDLLQIDGIKETLADKLHHSINTCYNKASISDLMASYHCFGSGFARRRIEPILKILPTILTDSVERSEQSDKIAQLHGYQDKIITKFLDGLDEFKVFYTTLPARITPKKTFIIKKPLPSSNKFINRVFCCTGFRPDEKLKKNIISNGGTFENTLKSNVTDLIIKSKDSKITSKIKTAQDKGVTILYLDSFL